MSEKHGVFISYARADGEEFAATLRDRIATELPQVRVWQDRTQLKGGVGWWNQITTAIEESAFMILVMTAAALQSEVVRKEWRYARQVGTCIFPIIATPRLDFTDAPKWMRDAHFYDLNKEWATFAAYIQEPCQTTSVAYMAPDLPTHFVPRTELEQLVDTVVDRETQNTKPGRVVLAGPGGFGKSALATALCHQEDVQSIFDDGIFWITLGENPDVLAGLSKIYAALTGQRPGFVDIEDAAVALAEKWGENDALVVIDDVWEKGHLYPFLRGGRNVTRIITTRNMAIAQEADHQLTIGEMSLEEAAAMLLQRLSLAEGDFRPIYTLVAQLGQWPLLLELAGATLQQRITRGDNLQGAMSYLEKALEKKGVLAFDRRDTSVRSHAIERTIEVSLEQLDPEEREGYAELGVFQPNHAIPLNSISALWTLDDFDTEERLQHLDALSLLRFNLQDGTVSINSMMQAYVAEKIQDPTALHHRLVEAWGDPLKLSDNYAWGMYIYHLIQGGQEAEAKALLGNFTWMQAKLDATDAASLVSDYDYTVSDPDFLNIQSAIMLSMHVLAHDKTQFAGQLIGRLMGIDTPLIKNLIEQAAAWQGAPWLHPLVASLTPPGGPLLRTILGHRGTIRGIAVLPNGRQAISGGEDGIVHLWDLLDETERMSLEGHTRGVNDVALALNGKRAASASDDYTVKIWDLQTGKELHSLVSHILPVTAVAMTQDGRYVISGSADNSLKLWDLNEDPPQSRNLRGHRRVVNVLALSADGKTLVSGSDDHTIRVWDLEKGVEIKLLQGHTGPVRALALYDGGKKAVSGGTDRTLKTWDLEKGVELTTLVGHRNWVNAVAVTPDGKKAVSASEDNTLKVWNLVTGTKDRSLRGHTAPVNALALSPDGRWVISGASDEALKVWDLSQGFSERTVTELGLPNTIRALAITPQKIALSGSDNRLLKLWNLSQPDMPPVEIKAHKGPIRAIAVTPDGKSALTAGGDKLAKVWKIATGEAVQTLTGHTNWVLGITALPNGEQALTGSSDRAVKLWDLKTGAELKSMIGHTDWVIAVAVTPDGRYAFSGGRDKIIKVWDLENGREFRSLVGHQDWIMALAVSEDGKTLISASDDTTLCVWDWQANKLAQRWTGHHARVRDVKLMPHNRVLSASDDHTLKVWDIATGEVLVSYNADAPLLSCAVSPDGIDMIAGEEYGKIHRLRLEGM